MRDKLNEYIWGSNLRDFLTEDELEPLFKEISRLVEMMSKKIEEIKNYASKTEFMEGYIGGQVLLNASLQEAEKQTARLRKQFEKIRDVELKEALANCIKRNILEISIQEASRWTVRLFEKVENIKEIEKLDQIELERKLNTFLRRGELDVLLGEAFRRAVMMGKKIETLKIKDPQLKKDMIDYAVNGLFEISFGLAHEETAKLLKKVEKIRDVELKEALEKQVKTKTLEISLKEAFTRVSALSKRIEEIKESGELKAGNFWG